MSIPPPAAPGKATPPGPPEHVAAFPPANGAGGGREAPAAVRVPAAVASVSCPVTGVGPAAVALDPASSTKAPLRLVPAVPQQPGVLSAPGGALVAKVAPVTPPVRELSKASRVAATLVSPVGSKAPPTAPVQLAANFQFPQGRWKL